MIGHVLTDGEDPRQTCPEDLRAASERAAPEIARASAMADRLTTIGAALGVAAVGGLTLVSLSHHRQAAPAPVVQAPAVVRPAQVSPAAPAPALSAPPPPIVAKAAPPADVAGQTPVLVMDASQPSAPAVTHAAASAGDKASTASNRQTVYFNQDEQFAARAGSDVTPTSHATQLSNPGSVVAQGTIIPAVLETALNSDLPGYARALVSQDVRSFDGRHVLIPRGSRLIGEYKSALQTGQTRAFIIWTRVLRPDGLSVQLGSPVTDQLGQAGLAGKVDRHFMERYGSAMLLSVVGGAASALGGGSNTLVIGTSTEATSAASVALQNQMKIPPTIRVPQGSPIQVFVARDLDFSAA